jgi:hypothetical protein
VRDLPTLQQLFSLLIVFPLRDDPFVVSGLQVLEFLSGRRCSGLDGGLVASSKGASGHNSRQQERSTYNSNASSCH